jgi:glycosyltransferase involved in cell wall biosynthesis
MLDELTAAIAGADAFVGSSMHGNIAAAVFGVPGALLALPTYRPSKLIGHARLLGRTDTIVDLPDRVVEVAESLLDAAWPTDQKLMAGIVADLNSHFDRCAAQLAARTIEKAIPLDEHRQWVEHGRLALAVSELTDRVLLGHVMGLEGKLAAAAGLPFGEGGSGKRASSDVMAEGSDPDLSTSTAVGPPKNRALPVSVVIPLFNGRSFLKDAVESVLRQTEPPLEIVIVDDDSRDGSVEAIADMSAAVPIRVVHQEHRGQSAARNLGVREAKGQIIAFLDQDDVWHAEHLAELCGILLDNPALSWVFSDFDEIDSEGRTVTRYFLRETAVTHPKGRLDSLLANDLMVIPSSSVMRRTAFDALGGFDEALQGYEDDDLFVRAFRAGLRTEFVDRSLTQFRVHPTSSSANGRFSESRMYYSEKLREQIRDDRRLNRYYFRDVVAPRFFAASLDDYVRAVSEGDWIAARRAFAGVKHFAASLRDHHLLTWKVALIANPRRFRLLLRLNGALPRRLRMTSSPILRLR